MFLKKIFNLLIILMMLLVLGGCGSKTSTNAPKKDEFEPYYGIWEVDSIRKGDLLVTVETLEDMGEYAYSENYAVIQEGGLVYICEVLTDYSASREWVKTEDGTMDVNGLSFSLMDDGRMEINDGSKSMYLVKVSNSQKISDIPKKEEVVEEVEPIVEETGEKEDGALSLEFKATMDAYEEFFDEYIEFMKNYNNSENPISMIADYMGYLTKYTDYMEKLDDIEDDDLKDAELEYYIDVTARINKKLLTVLD